MRILQDRVGGMPVGGLRGLVGLGTRIVEVTVRPVIGVADKVLELVLAGPVTERAVAVLLRGPLVDAIARDIVEYAVLERVLAQMLDARALDPDRGGAGSELERAIGAAFSSGRVQMALARALESQEAEQLVAGVFESTLIDAILARLVESDELWVLVEEIARSPAVTAAITQQSLGFADQVGEQVRRRSRRADSRLEAAARRIVRRHRTGLPSIDADRPADVPP